MKASVKNLEQLRACVAAAIILLAPGCGSESTPTASPAPQPQLPSAVVQLGSFGGSVTLVQAAGGAWTLNGQPISSNTEVEGDNGLAYRLTLDGGMWTAEFVTPAPLAVALGTSGEQVSLQQQEDGSYLLDATPVAEGRLVTIGTGVQYELAQGPDGAWEASFLPTSVTVRLGGSGRTLTLMSTAAGTWLTDGAPIDSGDTIERGGHTYELRREGSSWTAALVSAGSPLLTFGGGASGGGAAPRPFIPTPQVTTTRMAVLYDLPWNNLLHSSGRLDIATALRAPIQQNVPDTGLAGEAVDYGRYRGLGRSEHLTYAESGLQAIDLILGAIEAGEVGEQANGRQELIDQFWPYVAGHVDLLFGRGEYALAQAGTPAETVERLMEVRDALRSLDAFQGHFGAQIARAEAAGPSATASAIFAATNRLVGLGATESTRYGVARRPATASNDSLTAVEAVSSARRATAAFAYSPLAFTPRAQLPSGGTATYNGSAWAILPSAFIAWAGLVEVRVDFADLSASATVSALRSTTGTPLRHGSRDVEEIRLPMVAAADFAAGQSRFSASGRATLTYAESGETGTVAGSELVGQFVGASGDAAVGVMGTWTLGTGAWIRGSLPASRLLGAFGAERAP